MNKVEDDNMLVFQLSQGSSDALRMLYDIYSKRLYGLVFASVKDHDETKDIVQKVFIKVWNNRETIRHEANFKSFLFTIARNLVYNFFKQRYNQMSLKDNVSKKVNIIEPSSDQSLIEEDLFNLLQELIQKLPPRRKEIFVMNRFQAYTYKEIAEKLQISENTVDTQMRKALEFIKQGVSKEILSSSLFVFFLENTALFL